MDILDGSRRLFPVLLACDTLFAVAEAVGRAKKGKFYFVSIRSIFALSQGGNFIELSEGVWRFCKILAIEVHLIEDSSQRKNGFLVEISESDAYIWSL